MPSYESLITFYEQDFTTTLFPLETNRLLITQHTEELAKFVYEGILQNPPQADNSLQFLPQTRVYASKPGYHVRRTVKLDPVAEFFIYDIVHRNRTTFRKDFNAQRQNFGYVFENGVLASPGENHRLFKSRVVEASEQYDFWAKFDVSSYFNSIYHHDLVSWFREDDNRNADIEAFGKFFREINVGRSLDCLPQGIAPCKMIGSHFLKFVDNSARLRSELLLRFMDDFYLFSNDENKVIEDFMLIQRLVGEKGLSINPMKTQVGKVTMLDVGNRVDAVRAGLLQRRNLIIEASATEDVDENEAMLLNQAQVSYLMDLLQKEDMEEEDAELILALMRDHSDDIVGYLRDFLVKFPNLSRQVYYFCRHIQDQNAIGEILHSILSTSNLLSEFQLFWMAKIAEDFLLQSQQVGDILVQLVEHPNATLISKAKVLEIPERRYGLPEIRSEHIRTGSSDWLAWAAAIGSRAEPSAGRNHLLGYFRNSSPLNRLIGNYVINLP